MVARIVRGVGDATFSMAKARQTGGVVRTIEDVLTQLRAEFLEMPGMRLTTDQVRRLCGVEPGLCQAALDSLVDTKFLRVSADGRYARVTEGGMPRPRAARADLASGTRARAS